MKIQKLKKPLLELIPVFLGVLLALFFTNLNENRIDRNKINALLSKIALGNEKNIESLKIQLERNQMVLDSMTHYRDNSEISIAQIIDNTRGIRYIQFDLAAWNVLKSSELLIDVDYDLTSLLYLLNESIIYDANTISFSAESTDQKEKEKVITALSDYIVSIKHRQFLCDEIQKLLKEK